MKNPFKFAPIQTKFDGYHFRSRLEARWAVFFKTLGIPYEYEKEGYNLEGTWYLPDFWLPQQDCWVEIKGQEPTSEEWKKARLLALYTQKPAHIFYGNIELPHDLDNISSYRTLPAKLWTYPASEKNFRSRLAQPVTVPSHIIATLQKLHDAGLHLYVTPESPFQECELLVIRANNAPYAIDSLTNLSFSLKLQYDAIVEMSDYLEEHTDEFQKALTPAEGWKFHFDPQDNDAFSPESSLLCECDKCGAIEATIFADTHRCNDNTLGTFLHDTPRIMEAFTAARQARFERGAKS